MRGGRRRLTFSATYTEICRRGKLRSTVHAEHGWPGPPNDIAEASWVLAHHFRLQSYFRRGDLHLCRGDLHLCRGDLCLCRDNLCLCRDNLRLCRGNLCLCRGDLCLCRGDLCFCRGNLCLCRAICLCRGTCGLPYLSGTVSTPKCYCLIFSR